jgi:ribosome-binding factor A
MDDIAPISVPARRKAKLESFLKREIAVTVTQELRDPRIGFITITRAELASDQSTVTAYYTLLEPQKAGLAQRALEGAAHFVQSRYAPHLRLRRLPQLRFRYDDAQQQGDVVQELIRRARATDPDGGNTEQTDPTPRDPAAE